MTTPNDDKRAAPQVHDLAGMLQYQEKSIVSRMLVKNAGGSVTLFAFDAGEGLSEHTAPFDALVIGVDGSADIAIAGMPYAVGAGQTLLLPAGVPHAVSPVGRFKMLLVMIRGDRNA
ncbi:MAG: cupin domain-containing protein [Burkholderiales bacterium]|nr:cupin domain-containing protein [Burkholderiales bacterium]GIK87033.1 MAG: cupin [Betaproteobacteria bacterium]